MTDRAEQQSRQTNSLDPLPRSRIFWGGMILIIGFMSPLLIPVIGETEIADQWKVAITGLLLLGIPEVFMLIAVVVMGKSGHAYLNKCLLKLLRRYGPAERVGVIRYRVGLGMFVVPLLIGLLSPYVGDMLDLYAGRELEVAIASDVLFVSSLFVLGGEFWDKLRGLFIHGARVTLPGDSL